MPGLREGLLLREGAIDVLVRRLELLDERAGRAGAAACAGTAPMAGAQGEAPSAVRFGAVVRTRADGRGVVLSRARRSLTHDGGAVARQGLLSPIARCSCAEATRCEGDSRPARRTQCTARAPARSAARAMPRRRRCGLIGLARQEQEQAQGKPLMAKWCGALRLIDRRGIAASGACTAAGCRRGGGVVRVLNEARGTLMRRAALIRASGAPGCAHAARQRLGADRAGGSEERRSKGTGTEKGGEKKRRGGGWERSWSASGWGQGEPSISSRVALSLGRAVQAPVAPAARGVRNRARAVAARVLVNGSTRLACRPALCSPRPLCLHRQI
jgi:hypothetical protein